MPQALQMRSADGTFVVLADRTGWLHTKAAAVRRQASGVRRGFVSREDLAVHVLQRHALRFHHPPPHEETRQDRAQPVEAVREAEVLTQPGERDGDQPVGRPLTRGGQAQRGGPDTVREHLAEQHPDHRPHDMPNATTNRFAATSAIHSGAPVG